MGIKPVTYYQAICDRCGDPYDTGEYTAWGQPSHAEEAATDYGWFQRTKVIETIPPTDDYRWNRYILETVELICESCSTCDVCGTKDAYEVDNHLVCDDHEDHDFDATEGN